MSSNLTALIEVAIEPASTVDPEVFAAALNALGSHDPTLEVSADLESRQTILKGRSLSAIKAAVRILIRNLAIDVRVGAPQVAYRETLTKKVEVDYTHKKQTGSSGQFARVKIVFEPQQPGFGYEFENDIGGGAVPKEFVPGVEKGLNASRECGVLAGFPLIDFKATLVDGAFHEVDSNVLTFEIAARAAFRELKVRKAVKLLEPIMKIEVVTPDEFLGGIIGDINSRRGQVQGTETRGNAQVITAMVPLVNLFTYDEELAAITFARATATSEFSHFEEVPRSWSDDDPPPFRPAMGMRL